MGPVEPGGGGMRVKGRGPSGPGPRKGDRDGESGRECRRVWGTPGWLTPLPLKISTSNHLKQERVAHFSRVGDKAGSRPSSPNSWSTVFSPPSHSE